MKYLGVIFEAGNIGTGDPYTNIRWKIFEQDGKITYRYLSEDHLERLDIKYRFVYNEEMIEGYLCNKEWRKVRTECKECER